MKLTAQKVKFSIKCDRSFLRIRSHLLKKFLLENFIFCAVGNLNVSNNTFLKAKIIL